ncbi:MAG: helix-turn-helix domain-containing protein [Proteobacteria bacterium]|nr:helix-turn-helix domain-containing protein [Pseudomonadota bacterium]
MTTKVLVPVIKTEKDYKAALAQIEKLMDAKANSPEGDRLDVLATLIEAYEDKHYPIGPPDPIEAIKFRMDQMGYTRDDLARLIGGKSRVSELFSGSRKLSLNMIRTLHREWKIPADVLINDAG